ncbi:MAG TPA: hypothetical protein DHU55_14410 [Blastocatellia bacterium]|nr:hypothetical protein [Blastocatellia bacterium]
MYKKSTKYAAQHPDVVKRATGFPQTDELVRQRRRATPGNPIVATTGTCIYCGSNSTEQVRALQDKIKEIKAELRLIRTRYDLLTKSQRRLLQFVNALPLKYRPNSPKGRRKRR